MTVETARVKKCLMMMTDYLSVSLAVAATSRHSSHRHQTYTIAHIQSSVPALTHAFALATHSHAHTGRDARPWAIDGTNTNSFFSSSTHSSRLIRKPINCRNSNRIRFLFPISMEKFKCFVARLLFNLNSFYLSMDCRRHTISAKHRQIARERQSRKNKRER